jgi:hypothetical protein
MTKYKWRRNPYISGASGVRCWLAQFDFGVIGPKLGTLLGNPGQGKWQYKVSQCV